MFLKLELSRNVPFIELPNSYKFSSDLTKFCTYFSKSFWLLGASFPDPLLGTSVPQTLWVCSPLVCCFRRHW